MREPETLEEAARNLRYEVFRGLIDGGHADFVLTAHTLDDQAETVLMKLLRGAWTEGLSGIHPFVEMQAAVSAARHVAENSPRRGIVRPLLRTRRSELESYLRERGQAWRTDSSNADEAFTRNRLRHTLLPVLREYNPAVEQALANVAELAREDEARWQAELNRVLPQVLLPGKPVRGGGRAVGTGGGGSGAVALEIERLRGFDAPLRRRVVRGAARSLGVRLSFDETARLLALAGFGEDATCVGAERRGDSPARWAACGAVSARVTPLARVAVSPERGRRPVTSAGGYLSYFSAEGIELEYLDAAGVASEWQVRKIRNPSIAFARLNRVIGYNAEAIEHLRLACEMIFCSFYPVLPSGK